MEGLTECGQDLYFLDVRGLGPFNGSGIYFIVSDGITLIETGTSLVAPYVLEAVGTIGFQEEDIKRVIVTHIHLDHSGGTGWLVSRLPHLKVYVHEKGLKHLHDPTALIESAKTVYGSLESITAIHGDILPVPGDCLHPVLNSSLAIGGTKTLRIFDAPGHASHHLCVFEPDSGCLFSGEALGHHHPETGTIQPAVAPPGFNFEASLRTIEKISRLGPAKICFSQYGLGTDPAAIIEQSEQQLRIYHDSILKLLQEGKSTLEVVDALATEMHRNREIDNQFFRGMLGSIVPGYEIYFRRKGII
ncbi:MAG: MBL fold metallo-hydrolase [Pseudomonadales bacterium]|jgi:glyoxylase-like metal-dependent hydrolase (beta-lactamase superfamily II)|nr:MBL fold metallo-hydrolase [Pseudomonadales bacterium]MDP7597828.1 MBL fold metallo-hydrolase [Pseudomonadales bacterium]HJN53296.1 MBL fold metallo-hydrolase [Pseudomonadales bacterium]|tara:strand:+ start:232 stop:1140 length:909 start_codon:yes stop_codon:yes gene_type:complete